MIRQRPFSAGSITVRHTAAVVLRTVIASMVIVGLSGCESNGDNLQAWLRKARQAKGAKLKPLPEPLVYQPIKYLQVEERTPFEPVTLVAPAVKHVESEISPDFARKREVLEQFQLSELALVGMLELEGGMVALVQSPNGEVVRIKQGDFMGRNFGRVESMDAKGLVLREIVKDDAGRWQKRSTAFGFAEPEGG